MNNTPTTYVAVLIAVITAAVTLWTQRGGARARRQTSALEERAASLDEFKALREAAYQDIDLLRGELARLREEVQEARDEVQASRVQIAERDRLVSAASDHIRVLRPLIDSPPPLPEILRSNGIGL